MKILSALFISSLALASFSMVAKTAIIPKYKMSREAHESFSQDYVSTKGDTRSNNSQAEKYRDWFNLDYKTNGVQGVSADALYSLIELPYRRSPIIVAVIDSGVDVRHPDLAGKIWVNKREIPFNNIDDDGNGYIDDIHGWNYLGSRDGRKQVNYANLEVTREYRRYANIKKQREAEGKTLNSKELKFFKLYKADLFQQRKQASARLKNCGSSQRCINYFKNLLNKMLNPEFLTASKIVNDDPKKFLDTNYGNNQIIGPDASHGTHVAGAIAAVRNNKIGMNGVASHVKIMALRAVPNGDERDKDIANAIMYAVNNGARIINMSFGKKYSPYKRGVERAIAYAHSKGVLLFHAAGNDGKNNDISPSYPNKFYKARNGRVLAHTNFLEIGASRSNRKFKTLYNQFGQAVKDTSLAASFSNYGKKTLDFFSPGVNIYSTIPVNPRVPANRWYDSYNGTSMATPVAAGVAALIWAVKPSLTAAQLKRVLKASVTPLGNLKTFLPGDKNRGRPVVSFGSLSQTGGVINALRAAKYLGLVK